MPAVFTRRAVTVTGGPESAPGTWSAVEVLGIHNPVGARYGSVMLEFPAAYAFAGIPAAGDVIHVALDGTRLFTGFVTGYPGALGGSGEVQRLRAVDNRWKMLQRRVGDSAYGDFPVVGRRVVFNAEGARNRSEDPTDGIYTFAAGSTAEYWTRKQMLLWLVDTYLDDLMVVDGDALSAGWDGVSLNFSPYLQPLPMVIAGLAAEVGETWGIFPRAGDAKVDFVPVMPGGSTPLVIALPEVDAMGATGSASLNSAVRVEGGTSIEYATDTVEIHTGTGIVETTYAGDAGDEDSLLVSFAPADTRYEMGWRVNTAKYSLHGLGADLPMGSVPKRWLRECVTRYDGDGVKIAAASAAEAQGLGRALLPEQALWVTVGEQLRRVLGGFEIRHEEGVLLLDKEILLYGGTSDIVQEVGVAADLEPLYLTVATELEQGDYYRESASPLLPTGPCVETMYRSDIRPQIRWRSRLPVWNDAAAPSEVVAPETAEAYRDYQAALVALAAAALAARRRAETKVRVRTVDLTTAVALGRKLEISPAATGLSTDTVIVDVYYDLAKGVDALEVTATNNLAEFL